MIAWGMMPMSESPKSHPRPHRETIKKLLEAEGVSKPVENIGDYLKAIRTTSEHWQEEDWKNRECDEDYLLNIVRIVGQVVVPSRSNRLKTQGCAPWEDLGAWRVRRHRRAMSQLLN